ncbi:MAG: HEAT repeat domain-containing protein [Myxococcota bacterium]
MKPLCTFAVLGTLVAALFAAPAVAQRRPSVNQVREMLGSDDPATVQQGIEAVGLSGNARMVPVLSDRVRRGLRADLLDVALDTLAVLGRPEAGPVLFELSVHRRPAVRRKAVEAIVACRPEGGARALTTALSDSDPGVRGLAAVGLGQLGGPADVDVLFLAFDRGVLEAGVAIGQLATGPAFERLTAYLGRVPFDSLTPAFTELLARPRVPQAAKLDVIGRIGELATPGARQFLEELVALFPDDRASGPLRDAAEAAAGRISQ